MHKKKGMKPSKLPTGNGGKKGLQEVHSTHTSMNKKHGLGQGVGGGSGKYEHGGCEGGMGNNCCKY